MKKFLLKIVLFLLPVFVAGVVAEIALRQIPNEYKFKNEKVIQNGENVETLILGNSHAYFGINPEYLTQPALNGANVSQSLDYDLKILQSNIKYLTNLKVVVVPVSYCSLFSTLENGPASWRVKNYYLYYDLETPFNLQSRSEMFSNNLKVNCSRLYKYYIANEPAIKCSYSGWGTEYNSSKSKNLNETGKEAALRHTKIDEDILANNIKALYQLLSLCKQNNVDVVFCTLPAYTSYRNVLNKEQMAITKKTIEDFVSSNDNLIYIDYFADKSFTAADFYDGDHLNEKGAKKVSYKLNASLTKLYAKK